MICHRRVEVTTRRLFPTSCMLVVLVFCAVGATADYCLGHPCWSGGACVDGSTGYTCNCPSGTLGQNCETVHNNKCYRQSRDVLSHKEASAACVFMGGQLVDIKEPHEQQMLADIIRNTNDVSHWTFMKSRPPQLLHIDGSTLSLQTSWMARDIYGPFDICVLLDRDQSYKGDFHACTEQHNYFCESPVTPCQPDVCQHGGVCSSCFSDSPMCDCPPGYTGVFCETDINECASNPCQNGGTCHDHVNSFICFCRVGYDGVLCENDIDYCDPNPCPNGWSCVDQVVGFHCEVPHGARAASTFCMAFPCGPGWTCQDTGLRTGYTCTPVS
ncbi:FAT4 [Branchiostoma lanceolatum]|uniref:FAT4 protein n=1 Tax=Branchiostoma lanceolatum TaxID=7740 RepID=A0A8K0A0C8_BRALA|nr:FAT4 [Branchiostoma lanceolatum]